VKADTLPAIDAKLKFIFREPEHKVLPIPMTYERWMELAKRQNELRAAASQRQLTQYELEEMRRDSYG
jgi:hypothetical protein